MHRAKFDPIWDDDYDKKLQAEIKRRATVGGRTIMSKALLIGILKCGYCDYSMFQIKTRRTFKNGTKYLFRGYGCGSFLHKGTCKHNGKLQKVIDDLVLKEVLKLANDKTRAAYLEKVNKSKTDNRGELYELKEREFKRRLDEFDRINQAYKTGVDSLAEYKKNKEELQPILENLQKELISLNAQVNTPIVKLDWDKQYKSILSKFIESPSEEDVPTIRKILISLIDKIQFKSKPLYIKIFYKTTT